MLRIYLFLLLLTSILTRITGQYDNECLMPNQHRGRCVPVKSCKSTYELFNNIQKTGGSISNSDQQQLLALHCGSLKNVPLICCPISEIQLNANSLDILKNTTCGVYNVNKVSNGNDAALFGFPWMALLKYNVQREPFKCEGTLISDQYILTAAHCVHKLERLITQVRLGEYKISTDEDCIILARKKICAPPVEDVNIEEIIIHENYKGTFYNDIALLRLNRKIKTQRHIKPICLPIHDELREKEYEQYVISGWGKTQNGTQSDILQVALVPNVERQYCELQLKPHRLRSPLTIGQICAGGENFVDTCRGDSGGPLGFKDFYNGKPRFIQFGIVSFGVDACGEANVPTIYTNVPQYMQWITDHMR